jgi:DNA excision repair protein ERCC-4
MLLVIYNREREKEQNSEPGMDTQNGQILASTLEINLSLLLKFQEHIVVDLVEKDGLLLLGKGLGLNQIVANLLHVLSQSGDGNKRPLIILINATDEENTIFEEALMELSWTRDKREGHNGNGTYDPIEDQKDFSFRSILGNSGTVDGRRKEYAKGGIISVSNRVLVTDLLSHVLEPDVITGLVILHAENIAQYSMDRFVINLYRRGNKWGFVKAVSDDSEKFCRGFQPLQTKMKYFKLERSFLWPRFHIGVTESIQRKLKVKTEANTDTVTRVTEVRIQMTDYMTKIQNSLMASIEVLIGELRRNNPDLTSEYWSIENALDDNFVRSIVGSLNPSWHRISATTKKLLSELSTLKTFLSDLFNLDSVSFYQHIRNFVNEHTMSLSNKESLWLMIPEASATIACSKDRVYRKIKTDTGNMTANFMLEEPPKWEQLMLILDEINEEKLTRDETMDGPILIACASNRSCYQLERVLSKYKIESTGDTRTYSFRKIMANELRYQQRKKNSGVLMRKMTEDLKKAKADNDGAENEDDVVISKTFTKSRLRNTERRRARGGAVVSQHNRLMNLNTDDNGDDDIIDNDLLGVENDEEDIDEYREGSALSHDSEIFENAQDLEFELYLEGRNSDTASYRLIDRNSEVIIASFESIDLEELLPSYIICYEPDLELIRKVELFQASLQPAKCFFMYYGESVEEQIYLNSIKHEKDAFTRLIREKANMPKFFSIEDDEQSKFNESFRHMNSKTRIAGGGTVVEQTNKVVVDMRDFNSQLPFVCHLAGLEVIPALLTVGDYILSDEICVERKAVRDLIESLENGRLTKQCESMFKWYNKPVLLIEFEEGKSFSFEPFTTGFLTNSSSKHVRSNELEKLQLRLAALIRSFPKLSILWSSSPFETAKLFKELKATQKDPDIEFALTAGTNGINNGGGVNEDALRLLKLIPGITDANSLLIRNKVKTLYDFCQMSVEEMATIIGNESAQKAHKFMNKHYK